MNAAWDSKGMPSLWQGVIPHGVGKCHEVTKGTGQLARGTESPCMASEISKIDLHAVGGSADRRSKRTSVVAVYH